VFYSEIYANPAFGIRLPSDRFSDIYISTRKALRQFILRREIFYMAGGRSQRIVRGNAFLCRNWTWRFFVGRRAVWFVVPMCLLVTFLRISEGAVINIQTHLRVDEILAGSCVAL